MRQLTTEKILDYDITTGSVEKGVETICRWIEAGERGRFLVCANPHSLAVAEKDPVFKTALQSADMATPDGVGIVLASRILGGHIRRRVTGSDVFKELSEALNRRTDKTFSYFFLGSTEATLEAIRVKLGKDFPNIRLAGMYSPPFKEVFDEEDNRVMLEAVNRTAPDVLWVGMTAPKQEKWVFQNKGRLNVRFIGAIGAAFDFYSGKVKRSHPIFQRLGLEWLPRLVRDPRRLYDRMLISAPVFLWMVLKYRGVAR